MFSLTKDMPGNMGIDGSQNIIKKNPAGRMRQ